MWAKKGHLYLKQRNKTTKKTKQKHLSDSQNVSKDIYVSIRRKREKQIKNQNSPV